MSTLISSAVAGKAAAPKSAPRRRAAPPPPPKAPAKAATPISVSDPPNSDAPPSPPPTQQTVTPAPTQATTTQTAPRESTPQPPRQPSPPTVPAPDAAPTRSDERLPQHLTSDSPPIQARALAPPRIEVEEDQDEELPDLPIPQPSRKRQREPALSQEAAQPAKKVKRSSARSNATVQAAVQEEDAPAPSSRTTRRTTRNEVLNAAAASSTAPRDTGTAKRQAKSKTKTKPKAARKSAATVTESDAAFDEAEPDAEIENVPKTAQKPQKRPRKKLRKPQAEPDAADGVGDQDQEQAGSDANRPNDGDDDSDPENHEIDVTKTQMYSLHLGRDRRYGKTSEREKKMAKIDWDEVARKQREAIDSAIAKNQQPAPASGEARRTTEDEDGTADEPAEKGKTPDNTTTVGGVRFRIVDNMIVEDETTLTIDRQAQVEADAQTDAPVEEENDLTMRINRTTYINDRRRDIADRVPMWKGKSDPWTEEETDRFYDALKMFGTDFFIISKMFQPKTRKQIKLKFVREERLDMARINAALLGQDTKTMDIDHYARETGQDMSDFTKYTSLQHAQDEIDESMKDREVAMREAIAEEDANAAVAIEMLDGRETEKEKANRLRREKRKATREAEEAAGRVPVSKRGLGKKKKAAATTGGGGHGEAEGGAVEGEG